jgi:hypothetical protein
MRTTSECAVTQGDSTKENAGGGIFTFDGPDERVELTEKILWLLAAPCLRFPAYSTSENKEPSTVACKMPVVAK